MNLIPVHRPDGHQMLVLPSFLNDYLKEGFSISPEYINVIKEEEVILNALQENIVDTVTDTELPVLDVQVELDNSISEEIVEEISEEVTPQPTVPKKSKKWT